MEAQRTSHFMMLRSLLDSKSEYTVNFLHSFIEIFINTATLCVLKGERKEKNRPQR